MRKNAHCTEGVKTNCQIIVLTDNLQDEHGYEHLLFINSHLSRITICVRL